MKLINTVIIGGIFASFNALAIDCDSLEKVTVFTDSQVTGFQSGPENGFAERQVLFPKLTLAMSPKFVFRQIPL